MDIAVHRNELFCLHGNGRLSHFSLLSAERCVERLLRRESWPLAATVCCMFQHTVTASRVRHRRPRRERKNVRFHRVVLHSCLIQARKHVPIDRLEHLRSQLGSSADLELCAQLEEVLGKLEPPDSASSSRRSSISSHVCCGEMFQRHPFVPLTPPILTPALTPLSQESFNILDCGIYRVISRRGSQSEEETSSLINQSMSEEERLKEFSFTQEEDQLDHGRRSRLAALSRHPLVYKSTTASFRRSHFKNNHMKDFLWHFFYPFDQSFLICTFRQKSE